ncbi:ankyrin repeat domain-containing protein [Chitinophagaceae bacterium LWZ2-11]
MKLLFLAAFITASFSLQAQNNTLLDQSFWKNTPDLTAVKAEIKKGNNPSEATKNGMDAVVYAINGQASNEVIKFLLEQKGNDANKLTHDGRTYIFWAANRGNVEIVEYLISKGAKVNVEDTHDMTAIRFAAAAGQTNTKLYDVLINAGSDVKQKNRDGANLLLLAIANDKELIITDYFISKGLSLKDTDAAGNTAFNYAAKSGNIQLMKTLVQKGVKYNDNAMIMATLSGGRGSAANGIEVFQYLESLNIKPTAVNANGENALHNTVRKPNQTEIIKYFLSKGVSVNQADNDGNTPFMNAALSNRDTAVINLLAQSVKDINQRNKKGVSALAMAVKNNGAEVVQLLINKGADINTADAEGNNLAFYLIQSYSAQAQGGGQQAGRQVGGPGDNQPRPDAFSAKSKVLQEGGFNLTTPQKDGNTLYHLAIVKNDVSLLKRIEKLNVDVNAKNKEGLTPLHKAAMISKDDVILKYLLSIGAKKDVGTEFKETAFDLAKENEYFAKTNVSIDFLKP